MELIYQVLSKHPGGAKWPWIPVVKAKATSPEKAILKAKGWVKSNGEAFPKGTRFKAILEPMSKKNSGLFEPDSAEDLAVGFHGRASQETFEVEERRNFRQDLAMLGELEELEVFNELAWNETGELKTFTFSRKKKDLVRLAGSPDRRQLFLVGGDQEIPDSVLGDLAGDRQATKDKVSLGFVYSISYWSDKHHLEGSNGVMEAYMHCFGESTFENPDARQDGQADYLVFMPEQKLGAGLLPELVYDRLNMTLELVGGGYEIRDEGIWD